MHLRFSIKLPARLVIVLAASAFFCTVAAQADEVDNWFEHKIPSAEPEITYNGDTFNLKFSHPSPPASLVPPVWRAGLSWQEKATNGKLIFKEYGAGSLHGAKDGFKAVRSHITDYATCFVAHEGRGFPFTKVFELPFVTPSNPLAGVRVVAELAPRYFKPEFEKREVYYGYMVLVGAADIMSRKPIRKLEDMQGLKIIAQGFDPLAAKALGAVIVNIPYPDIYASFQQGIVDAVLWVDPGFVPYKIYELAKYHTTLNISAQHIDTCINKEAFDALPRDLKNTFYNFQQRMAYAVAKRVGVDFRAKAMEIYKENGVEMITLPPEELARWKAAMRPVLEQWADKYEAQGLPARELLADIEKLTQKYNTMNGDEIFKLIVEKPVPGIIDY
ncbi:MAG: TRAP transporter substrate-binding protein DctP [Desulfobacterales bacterium]|nr:MAG: TRAP transporter substrate-binding protein DctP [Desulfobacterales bacterium]